MDQTNEKIIGGAKLVLKKGDITAQTTDAIVNAANSSLMGGGGVDGAIHRVGGTAIKEECKLIVAKSGRLDTGRAVITTAGNLKAKFVVHTVGPVWHGGNHGESDQLVSAYHECLKLASEYKLKSMSFPSISTGAYGYPVSQAAEVAISTVVSFMRDTSSTLEEVYFVLFDTGTYHAYSFTLDKLMGKT
jgi:O-acetyl-ADP-ribose deacetylase (regulator of RNase III)